MPHKARQRERKKTGGKNAPVKKAAGKLAALGIALPPLPTTSVGNLPKHTELIEMRYKVAKGVQQAVELERKERLSTEIWIRQQERVGLDVLVDGQMNRGDMIAHFAKGLDGFVEGGAVRVHGNRYYHRPILRGPLAWRGPIVAETWKQFQRMTHKPLKAVITGPYTLIDWSFNEHYRTREAAVRDAVQALRREVMALVEAGVKILQIDEPALSTRPEEFSLVADGIKELTKGLACYVILHHAYGPVTPLWSKLISLPVDQISLEMANSDYAALAAIKKTPTTKDLAIGVIDAHEATVETAAVLRARLKKIRAVIPARRLWLTIDSGLKSRPIESSIAKLEALVELAANARRTLR